MSRTPLREATRVALADRSLGDKVHRATLHTHAGRERLWAELPNATELRQRAREARLRALDRQPELLDMFARRLAQRGVSVHRAATATEAADQVTRLVTEVGDRVIKSKSMTSEEVRLNDALERAEVEVTETDLGELIVQLAGQAPSHVTAPAIHLSVEDIAALFHAELGTQTPDWIERGEQADEATRRQLAQQLSLQARSYLRERFLRADVGISGANFLVAATGTIVLVENEANIQLTTTLPRRHIVLAGIDKLVETEADLAVLLQLLPRSATAQRQTCYVSLFADHHPDLHVVLLDGGRSRLRSDPELRDLLTCIRCGACLNACPVYRNIGGHAYGGAYAGPIGALLLPALAGDGRFDDLPFASSLCGACSEVCPVLVPLAEHLLTARARRVQRARPDELALPLGAASVAMRSGRLWALGGALYPLLRRAAPWLGPASAWTAGRELPAAPTETFHHWWRRQRRAAPSSEPMAAATPEPAPRPEPPAASAAPDGPLPAAEPTALESERSLRTRFAARLAELGPAGQTELVELARADEVRTWLAERIRVHAAEQVVIEGEGSPRRHHALGITSAALLVAETGGIVLDLAQRSHAWPATLVDTHVVVARPEQLCATLADALAMRSERRASGSWHDVQLIVTGPSRTADIEKVLVIPAHGPRRLVVVLCPEPVDLGGLRPSVPAATT